MFALKISKSDSIQVEKRASKIFIKPKTISCQMDFSGFLYSNFVSKMYSVVPYFFGRHVHKINCQSNNILHSLFSLALIFYT